MRSIAGRRIPLPVPEARSHGLLNGAQAVLFDRRLDRWIRAMPGICATFLAKLSIPPFGAMGQPLATPLMGLTGAVGLMLGRLVIDPKRFMAWAALVALLWGIQVFRIDDYSLSSMLLFTVLHFPYVLHMKKSPDYAVIISGFQKLALTMAGLGLAQYLVQFFIGSKLAFPIENYFPEAFKLSRFNMQGYVEYGADVYRTNGVFMLEPSFFSQLLAVGLLIETMTRMRLWVFGVLTAGIIVSYSGTGLMLIAACMPWVLIAKRRWDVLIAGAAFASILIGLAALADNPYLNVFFKRAGEFTSIGSSGFARFVGGFYLFEQFLWPNPLNGLFGLGAGSIKFFAAKATYASGTNALFKMVFEFGLIGGLAYFAFLWYCFYRSSAPLILRITVALTYLLGGIYVPFSHSLALGLLIWPNPATPTPPAPKEDSL